MLFLILHLYSKLTDTAHFYERKRARQNAIDMQRAGFEPATSGDVTRKIPFSDLARFKHSTNISNRKINHI
jgi:hypothetical protein